MALLEITTRHDNDYSRLIHISHDLFSRTNFAEEKGEEKRRKYAKGFALKIYFHLVTLFFLSRGTNVKEIGAQEITIGYVDHVTARVIVRVAFESYLVYFSLSINSNI